MVTEVDSIERGLRDDWETPAAVLCMMPGALSGPLADARASLRVASEESDRQLALQLTRSALEKLSGVPGAEAQRTREQLSRLFYRLARQVEAVVVDGAAPKLLPPEPGPLGPVEMECAVCGELFPAPKGKSARQRTVCPRCRRAERKAQIMETVERPQTTDHRPQTPEPETQECRVCHAVKPLEEFPKNYTYKNGHESRCLECRRAWYAASKAQPEEKPAAPTPTPEPETVEALPIAPETRQCRECQTWKPLGEFPKKGIGYLHVCLACAPEKAGTKERADQSDRANRPGGTAVPTCKVCGKGEPEVEFLRTSFGTRRTCNGCAAQRLRESLAEKKAAATEAQPGPEENLADQSDPASQQGGGGETQPATNGTLRPASGIALKAAMDEALRKMQARRPLPPPAPEPPAWSALLAPVMLAAGALGLAAYTVGRVFRAVSTPTEP